MPIYDETWNEGDYLYQQRVNLKTLPRNHLNKLKALKFDFIEYKANQLLACHIYERMLIHCYNQYGLGTEFQRPECVDAYNYFHHCIQQNAGIGLQKTYFPEQFLGNPYARPSPHLSQIL